MSRSIFSRLNRRFGKPSSGADRRKQVHKLYTDIHPGMEKIVLPTEHGERKLEVLIIGAGFAGLSAGHHLAEANCKVTVLEARERVGGRVHSLKEFANEQIIEGGAELIGTNHQLWMKLARKFGLSFDAVTQDDLFNGAGLHEPFTIDGKPIDSEAAKKLYKLMNKVNKKLTKMSKGVNSKLPWLSNDATAMDNTLLSDWLDQELASMNLFPNQSQQLRTALELDFANNNAVPTSRQSLLGLLAMIKGGGGKKYWDMSEVFRCSEGNDKLATELKQSIEEMGGKVVTGTPVASIEILPKQVYAKTSAGEEFTADVLVLAIPPSTWSKINVNPAIPDLYHCQMGKAVKYLSVLTKRFWVEKNLAPSGTIDSIGMTWEGTDNQSLLPGKDPELTVFAGGDTADKLVGMDIKARTLFYQKALDGSFENDFTANQKQELFMSWPTDPWTMAGYSFPNKGEVCTKIKALNHVFAERMLFAGEHTCMAFVGYMEGALQSGRNAALKIHGMVKAGNLPQKNLSSY